MKIREQVKLLHTLINKYKKPQNKNQTKRYKNDNIPSPRNGFIGTYNHLNMFMSEKHIIHISFEVKRERSTEMYKESGPKLHPG